MFNRNMGAALDRYITGNYGEDQFRESDALVEALSAIVHKALADGDWLGVLGMDPEVANAVAEALVAAGVTLDRPEVEVGMVEATCRNCGAGLFETDAELSAEHGSTVWSHVEDTGCDDPLSDSVVTFANLNPDCGCGHPMSVHAGRCFGTGADLDPIYQIDPNEACACVTFEAMD